MCDGPFATERIEICVVAGSGLASLDLGAGGAEMVGEVIENVVLVVAAGGPLAAEEDIFEKAGVGGAAGEVGFEKCITAYAVPIDFSIGFLDAATVTVIGVDRKS